MARTTRQICSGRGWQKATASARQAWAQARLPCSLCHQPIDYGLAYPHKRSLTVDHTLALIHGGSPLDPRNWRPAHYSCNSRKGAQDRPRKRRTSLTW